MKNTNRDLFAEAIADATAVKKMAIANAKAALEESFTPHLTQMLSAKLQEMESEEETVDEVEDVTEVEVSETEDVTETETTVDEEMDLDELLAELESEEVEESVDLNEVEDETEESEDETETEDAEEAETEEDEPLNLEDMSEDDLKAVIEDVIKDMVAAGDIEAGHEGMEDETETEVEDEEEVSIEEILAEIEAIDEAKKKKTEVKKDEDKEKLKKELKEAKETVDSLSHDLNEVNLLNAKLLYVNKIFKAKNLTENQKVKVITSFDKAKTVKETKLVYETILESLKEKKVSPINESRGFASKATGNSTKGTTPILESNDMVKRFQKIAGISTN